MVLHIPSTEAYSASPGNVSLSLAQQNTFGTSRESQMDLCSCSICEFPQVLVISDLIVGASVPLLLRQASHHFPPRHTW